MRVGVLLKNKKKINLLNKKTSQMAWEKFWRLGKKLNNLWKTKKTSIQVLKESRE